MDDHRSQHRPILAHNRQTDGNIGKAVQLLRHFRHDPLAGFHGFIQSGPRLDRIARLRLRRQFGMQEGQFKRFYKEAMRRKGVTGELLLQLLETRLDNLVYRLGFAPSRRAARQFVLHSHVSVNGKKASVPSMILKVGDVIEVRDRPRSRDLAARSLEAATTQQMPTWLSLDRKAFRAEVLSIPTREQIAPIVDEQAIVELYSR